MKMTKTLALVALIAGGLLAGTTLPAQDAPKAQPPGAQGAAGGRGHTFNIDGLAKQLALTDDQKPKVQAAIDDLIQKARDLRQKTGLTQDERRAKIKELRDEMDSKLKAILTAEQYAKWEKMHPGARQPAPKTEEKSK